jgi:hypothetical protein
MPSPFPGMDPFIESQGRWRDFHTRFISAIGEYLAERLPESYAAQYEEEVHTVTWSDEEVRRLRPDVTLIRRGDVARTRSDSVPAPSVATREPVTIPLAMAQEEVRDLWIEIIGLPGQELVTVIEVLSLTHKASSGREEHLAKRRAVLGQPVHLVELDLLRGGGRVPMREPLPPGDLFAFVARHERRPDCEVYAWSLRDRLPVIPIPLKAPDPDLPLDLAALFDATYDQGRYARLLRYDVPLSGPLRPEDREWAEATAQRQG